MNTYGAKVAWVRPGEKGYKEIDWAYHWNERNDSCKQEPNEALSNGNDISGRSKKNTAF